MKPPEHECPLSSRCELVNDQLIEARVEYVRSLEELQERHDYWRDKAIKGQRALEQIGEMVSYEANGLPIHAGVPEAVREALDRDRAIPVGAATTDPHPIVQKRGPPSRDTGD
jgi:hypothetical protein